MEGWLEDKEVSVGAADIQAFILKVVRIHCVCVCVFVCESGWSHTDIPPPEHHRLVLKPSGWFFHCVLVAPPPGASAGLFLKTLEESILDVWCAVPGGGEL